MGRLLVNESQKYHPTALDSLCLGILVGQMKRGGLTGQGCVYLNAYTCINKTYA